MKRLTFIAAIAGLALTGCETVPLNPDTVAAFAGAAGTTAAIVCNSVSTDAQTKYVIARSVETASRLTPSGGMSAKEAWLPVIDSVVNEAVAAGKLTDAQAKSVIGVFGLVTDAFAYFEARYPEVRTSRELMSAAVSAFCTSFLVTYDAGGYCPDCCREDECPDCRLDLPLYRKLKARLVEARR